MSTETTGRGPLFWSAAAASLLAPVLVPALVVGAHLLDHAVDFHGVCGPYAPDIPEHPCPEAEYLANFFGGFSGIALTMIAIAGAGGTSLVVGAGWALAFVVRAVRARARRTGVPGA